jgi:hypothetical protein
MEKKRTRDAPKIITPLNYLIKIRVHNQQLKIPNDIRVLANSCVDRPSFTRIVI